MTGPPRESRFFSQETFAKGLRSDWELQACNCAAWEKEGSWGSSMKRRSVPPYRGRQLTGSAAAV